MAEIPRSYHETAPAEEFASGAAERAAATPATRAHAAGGDPPAFERAGLAEQLQRLGYPAPPLRARFELDGMLGAGANGRVYAARDHDLERPVAVKMLADARPSPETLARFVEEARITAALEHPNVLPVHDLEINSQGQVFFTTKRIHGRSLGSAIEQSTPAHRVPPLDDANALVSVFIGVCQALALAHRQGIVHQDVKPDNIMLGDFGEVLMVDWGSARRLDRDGEVHIYGTPLYMSPEQARRELPDRRCDVYCVGATLFHALTLRPPAWNDDEPSFWKMKAAGELQPPTAAERAAAPAPLLAIALRALAPRPNDRYADASALLDDLKRYQAGLAVSAWREPWWSRLRRWHRRNRRAVWSWAAAAAVVGILAASLWQESRKEIARWGELKVSESFADDSWRKAWLPYHGGFEVRDHRLVSTGGADNILMLDRPLHGAIAIEYDGEMLPGCHPCDISLIWARRIEKSDDGARVVKIDEGYQMKVGAYDGAYTAITGDIEAGVHLATADFRPQPGRRYRIRVEIVDNRLTLAVDGKQLCEWEDDFPFASGYVGIYGHYAGKAFSDLRIYQREVPEKVPATAIGDATARSGDYVLAAEQYADVAAGHPGSALGREARWKQGLCYWRVGQHHRARDTWAPLRGGERDDLLGTYDIEQRFDDGDIKGAFAAMESHYPNASPEARKRTAMLWVRCAKDLGGDHRDLLEAALATHDRCLAEEHSDDYQAGLVLLKLGRYEEVLTRYPYLRWLCAEALGRLGRPDLIVRDYRDQRVAFILAAFNAGFFDQLDTDREAMYGFYIESLWARGRGEEVLRDPRADNYERAMARLSLGRPEEVVADPKSPPRVLADALIALGRTDEAMRTGDQAALIDALVALGDASKLRERVSHDNAGAMRWADLLEAISAAIDGDAARGRAALMRAPAEHNMPYGGRLDEFVATYALAARDGDFGPFDSLCAGLADGPKWAYQQTLWHDAAYLLGRIDDDAYLAQPYRAWTRWRLPLLRAMRAERAGKRDEALADYRAWVAQPLWQRGQSADGTHPRFVAWRIAELSHR